MRKWRTISGPEDEDVVLEHSEHSSAYVMSLKRPTHPKEWWVSGRLQSVKTFGPYPTIEAAKDAAEMLQEQGLLY
jgi:hypothetical protein